VDVTEVVDVSPGGEHTCAVQRGGQVYCWGSNERGQLGTGDREDSLEPVAVTALDDAIAVSAGQNHTNGLAGQLGRGSTESSLTPVDVADLSAVSTLATGVFHTCAVTETREAWCWGMNEFGQLGDGSTVTRTVPVLVSAP